MVRWIERSRREWPDALHRAGVFARNTLLSLQQKGAEKSAAFMRVSMNDLARFNLLYRQHRWIGRHRLALPKPRDDR